MKRAAATILLALAAGCGGEGPEPAPFVVGVHRWDDAAVVEAVLRDGIGRSDARGPFAVVLARPAWGDGAERVLDALPGAGADAVASFVERNAEPGEHAVWAFEDLGVRAALLDAEELAELRARDDPDTGELAGLDLRYPGAGGYWTFTLPGYGADANEAVVHAVFQDAPRSSSGHLVRLRRQHGRWAVVEHALVWIS